MNITVIGTGYVGLVVGACLADMGNSVLCVDKDSDKIKSLQKGIITIYEPGLEDIVKTNLKESRLLFTTDIDTAVKFADVCFIAVGTPQGSDGSADLHFVLEVAEQIAKSMNGYKVIVDKSTVPVGTAEKVKNIIKQYTNHSFDVVSNPEFLKQGNAVDDFLYPDRIVVGCESEKAQNIMEEIYEPYLRTSNKVIIMDIKSAEMTKYAANSFLATKISFMNEIANLCEKTGANIEKVRIGIASDTRIGSKFLFPGLGYGGSCFPKDVRALVKIGDENGCDMKLLSAVNLINENQRVLFINKIISKLGEDLTDKVIGIWGLSFKPKTNDMREAPSITIINALLKRGAKIQAYDPQAMETAKKIFKDTITYAENSYKAIENANCLLLLTEWNEFRRPNFNKIKLLMKSPLIFDGRNQYNQDILCREGFEYYCIGC